MFCPEDLEFLSRTAKNLEFLSRTLKNLEFLSRDEERSSSRVTKTQGFLTWVTKTQHFLPWVTKTQGLRDKTNSYPPEGPKSKPEWPQEIFVPSWGTKATKFWFWMTKIDFKRYRGPKKGQKTLSFYLLSKKKPVKNTENVLFWFLKFLCCASSFFFILRAKIWFFSSFLLSVGSQILIFWFWKFYFEKFEVKFHEKFGYGEKVCHPCEKTKNSFWVIFYLFLLKLFEKYSSCFSWLFWEKNIFLDFFGRKIFFFTFLGEKQSDHYSIQE